MSLSLELIGEFKGKNTVYRVLPDGQIETSGQGLGKIMGIDAMILFTTTGLMADGLFMGEGTGVITTMAGETVTLQMNSIGWPSGNGGVSRGASTQVTASDVLMRLNKAICLHEYKTDMTDNWVGKIWEWKQ
ncbi:MAG: hypothetical protein ACFCUE_02555 [Candidatus Bathyarchaeia archaeon]